ncbi:hypothetical protein EOA75_11790 [Mesorhizobium sp. M1A.F.Ca.IN.022.07.1.1]|uniref:hypothetical protein n=1 Tax=unclassified Mesorhizobium TaxID=325217 RepID=UPI000FC9980C|nr:MULTISPECIES: hypothetical protein [unclassified Mesorhizobium]RUV94329.1 hypothetical protein EOA75_11790 [Mesorhizobium sp. M1A.F.Ca.IN.022.07.1.1]TIQ86449.1 MAG: hypothetical protein E5X38_15990 [Mesorhizobium sp.]
MSIIIDGEILPPRRKAKPGAATDAVIKGPKPTFDNRGDAPPSSGAARAHQILNILTAAGQPQWGKIGHLPRTGDIVDALGLPRTKTAFASVSRSLARLERAGRIVSYAPAMATRGNGFHWAVKP